MKPEPDSLPSVTRRASACAAGLRRVAALSLGLRSAKPGVEETVRAVLPMTMLLGMAAGMIALTQSSRAPAPGSSPGTKSERERAVSAFDGDAFAPLVPLAPNLFTLHLTLAAGRGK